MGRRKSKADAYNALSKRAKKLLCRIYDGDFYPAFSERTPQAMHELVAADLIGVAGRVIKLQACFVPPGTVALELERIPKAPKWLK